MARDQPARILHARLALEQRLGQIADLGDDRQHEPHEQQRGRAEAATPTGGRPARRTAAPRDAAEQPATAPERVFPGLTAAPASGPPIASPANIAALSQTQVTTSGKNTSQVPAQERSGTGACRSVDQKRRQRRR